MKFRKKLRTRPSSIIYFIPLVNVVFLIIFFSVAIHALSVKLEPVAETGLTQGKLASAEPVNLSVLPGTIMLNGKPVKKQDIVSIPIGKTIIISASPEITFLYLADLLDILRSSGHTNLFFTTSPIHN